MTPSGRVFRGGYDIRLDLSDDCDLESRAWFFSFAGTRRRALQIYRVGFERSEDGLLVLLQKVEIFCLCCDNDPLDVRA